MRAALQDSVLVCVPTVEANEDPARGGQSKQGLARASRCRLSSRLDTPARAGYSRARELALGFRGPPGKARLSYEHGREQVGFWPSELALMVVWEASEH